MLTQTIPPALMAEIGTLVLRLMAQMRSAPADGIAFAAISEERPETGL
ncbi:hypothetical protein [Paraburkholderia fungorum]|nr:hypothetical protein [Paraburkholderia fungorum]MBB5546681.1 hypothetical protein [Paraburkholderia fungorum]